MPADAAELADRKVSRYQSARDNRGKPIALVEILEAIQAGHWENPVAAIREALAAGDSAKAEGLKTALEGFTAAGVFAPTRKKTNIVEPTGCIIADVDHLASPAEAKAIRDTLGNDPHVLAAFVSPSGRGVKAIFYCGTCADDAEAKSAWRALADYLATAYSIQTDPSGKDVCRLCFVSHDPGAIIRTGEVRPFTARAEAPKPAAPKVLTVSTSKPSTAPEGRPFIGQPPFGLPPILADANGNPHPARIELLTRFATAAMQALIGEHYKPGGEWLDQETVAGFAFEYAFTMLARYDGVIEGYPL